MASPFLSIVFKSTPSSDARALILTSSFSFIARRLAFPTRRAAGLELLGWIPLMIVRDEGEVDISKVIEYKYWVALSDFLKSHVLIINNILSKSYIGRN
jgi:hypothetical protein